MRMCMLRTYMCAKNTGHPKRKVGEEGGREREEHGAFIRG